MSRLGMAISRQSGADVSHLQGRTKGVTVNGDLNATLQCYIVGTYRRLLYNDVHEPALLVYWHYTLLKSHVSPWLK